MHVGAVLNIDPRIDSLLGPSQRSVELDSAAYRLCSSHPQSTMSLPIHVIRRRLLSVQAERRPVSTSATARRARRSPSLSTDASLRSPASYTEAPKCSIFSSFSVNHVIHCAGRLGIEASIKNPNLFYQCNVLGSINLLNAMIDNGVCNMIFSSSGAVYGNDSIRPFNEKE